MKPLKRSVLRASVPLIYAHWEGHVIFVAKSYVEFLAIRKPKYSTLKSSFRLNEFNGVLGRMGHSQASHQKKVELLNQIIQSRTQRFRRIDNNVISFGSNLRADVLRNVCSYLSVDTSEFGDHYDFIDKILAHRRNNIAHGEYLEIDEKELVEMSDRVITIMRTFNNLVDNDVFLENYKAP